MTELYKEIKLFTIFQYDLEEDYLREMAKKGYHFKSVTFPCFYSFEIGEPKDIVYRLDFKGEDYKKEEGYKLMLEESGWEYITEMAEFEYYRKDGDKENLELFSDKESRLDYLKSVVKRRMTPSGFMALIIVMNFFTSSETYAKVSSLTALAVLLILSLFLIKDYKRLKNKA